MYYQAIVNNERMAAEHEKEAQAARHRGDEPMRAFYQAKANELWREATVMRKRFTDVKDWYRLV